jgi:transposase InsO family protein
MPKTPPYSPEFRAEAVRLLRSSGRPVPQLAKELGISEQSLRNWSRQVEVDDGRAPGVRVCEDLVDRAFAAAAPNRVWVADITYPRTWEGWLYLIAVQDLYSRRIVGWSMADHMRTELVCDALQWLSPPDDPRAGWSGIPTRAANSSRWPLASKPAPRASPSRWAVAGIASITPSPRASSPP